MVIPCWSAHVLSSGETILEVGGGRLTLPSIPPQSGVDPHAGHIRSLSVEFLSSEPTALASALLQIGNDAVRLPLRGHPIKHRSAETHHAHQLYPPVIVDLVLI
jgi:hypothetical protein